MLQKIKGLARVEDIGEHVEPKKNAPNRLPDKAIDSETTRKHIFTVIDKLPNSQRIFVMLHYFAGFPTASISEMLEIGESIVKTNLSLAHAKIRSAVEGREIGVLLTGSPISIASILKQAVEKSVILHDSETRMWKAISNNVQVREPLFNNHRVEGVNNYSPAVQIRNTDINVDLDSEKADKIKMPGWGRQEPISTRVKTVQRSVSAPGMLFQTKKIGVAVVIIATIIIGVVFVLRSTPSRPTQEDFDRALEENRALRERIEGLTEPPFTIELPQTNDITWSQPESDESMMP
jgi:hypothetical protein